jgi:hypothetical protein
MTNYEPIRAFPFAQLPPAARFLRYRNADDHLKGSVPRSAIQLVRKYPDMLERLRQAAGDRPSLGLCPAPYGSPIALFCVETTHFAV